MKKSASCKKRIFINALIIFMRMASIIDGEPSPFLYSDVTAALVND
ncbi:hypothetical protein ACEUCV_15455 [Aeromonas veronii]